MTKFKITNLEHKSFLSSGKKTILDEAIDAGIIFDHSCKNGRCGSCKATLLEGEILEVQPQTSIELQKEDREFLTCCCTAASDIVIDAEDISALHGIKCKIFPSRISALEFLSKNILLVRLRIPPTSNLNFLPGQFIDVIGPNAIKRSYSISSKPTSIEISLLIKRIEGGYLSDYWFERAKLNDLLRIEGPKGTFFCRDRNKKMIFLATGTGIAPIRSILESLDDDSDFHQENSISLFWGNRAKEDFVWTPNFKNLEVDVNLSLSRLDPDWNGEICYVHDLACSKVKNIEQNKIYACGSIEMINSAKTKLLNIGLNEKNFYSDAFVQSF